MKPDGFTSRERRRLGQAIRSWPYSNSFRHKKERRLTANAMCRLNFLWGMITGRVRVIARQKFLWPQLIRSDPPHGGKNGKYFSKFLTRPWVYPFVAGATRRFFGRAWPIGHAQPASPWGQKTDEVGGQTNGGKRKKSLRTKDGFKSAPLQ